MGIIDSFAADPASACSGADLVLLAAPVGSFVDLVKTCFIVSHERNDRDRCGSVKGRLVHGLESIMPPDVYFVGAHPIAGSDRSGIDFSDPDLFSGALCIITPSGRTEPAALRMITEIWNSLVQR